MYTYTNLYMQIYQEMPQSDYLLRSKPATNYGIACSNQKTNSRCVHCKLASCRFSLLNLASLIELSTVKMDLFGAN